MVDDIITRTENDCLVQVKSKFNRKLKKPKAEAKTQHLIPKRTNK